MVGLPYNRNRRKRYCSYSCVNRGTAKHGYSWPSLNATAEPTRENIILAAGWFEGEGHARCLTRPYGQGFHHCVSASVAQKHLWMLEHLRAWFGGSIGAEHHGCSAWRLTGARAVRFLSLIYPYLSPWRREQITSAANKAGTPLEVGDATVVL